MVVDGLIAVDTPAAVPVRRRRSGRRFFLAAVLYALVALALDHRVLTDLNGSTTGWVSADSHTFVWWMQWLPTALERGLNPLLTDYVHAPLGVNAMWNIPVTVIAALMLPVTVLVGPVAAYNLAMMLGPVVSGLLMVVALMPWTQRWTSRIVAGGLYAFSPYVLTHFMVGHLNLVWPILPPILLMAVRAMFIAPPRHAFRSGALLGVALTLQVGIYTQTLALGALVLVLTALVLACARPNRIRERLPTIGRMAAGCVVTVAVLCAYPLYLLLFGPVRPSGQLRPALDVRADPLNAVLPTPVTIGGSSANVERMNAYAGEQGGYVGVAMLLLLIVACMGARGAVAHLVTAVGLLTFVFSLGPSLTMGKDDLAIWLPWRLLEDVPLLSVAEPVRLQLFVALCVAMVVALWIDRLGSFPPGWRRLAGTALVVVAVASWLPGGTAKRTDAPVPEFFRNADRYLERSDIVVTVPRPDGAWTGGARPILWQAESHLAYRTTGGSFISSDPRHDLLHETPENMFEAASRGLLDGLPPPDDAYVRVARQQLLGLGVTAMLVVPRPDADFSPVEDFAARVAGNRGEFTGGVHLYRLTAP